MHLTIRKCVLLERNTYSARVECDPARRNWNVDGNFNNHTTINIKQLQGTMAQMGSRPSLFRLYLLNLDVMSINQSLYDPLKQRCTFRKRSFGPKNLSDEPLESIFKKLAARGSSDSLFFPISSFSLDKFAKRLVKHILWTLFYIINNIIAPYLV